MKTIARCFPGRIASRRVPLTTIVTALVIVGFCGSGAAKVIGCPQKPITLVQAEKLVFSFTEDPKVPEVCSFTISEFTLNTDITYKIFESDGKAESDRIVAFGAGGQTTICFGSDPDFSKCDIKGEVVSLGNEDPKTGIIVTRTLAGTSHGVTTGYKFIVFSDGTNVENNGECSDSFVGAKPGRRANDLTCALPTPEPGTVTPVFLASALGFGVLRRWSRFLTL